MDNIWVCSECGSENVLEPTWVFKYKPIVAVNLDRVEGVDFDLCNDCKAQMTIIPKKEYIEKEGT